MIKFSPIKFFVTFSVVCFFLLSMTSITTLISNGGAISEGGGIYYDNKYATPVNYLVFIFGLLSIILLYKKSFFVFLIEKKIYLFVMGYFYICAISIFNKNNIDLSFVLNNVVYMMLMCMVYFKYDFKFLLKIFRIGFLYIFIISLIGVFLFPEYSVSVGVHEGAWQGIYNHKNQFGFFLFCYLLLILIARREKFLSLGWFVVILILIFATLIMSSSSTALLISLLSMLVFLFDKLKNVFLKKIFNSFFVKILMIIFLYYIVNYGDDFISSVMSKSEGGYSNRDTIWLAGLFLFYQFPLMGYIQDPSFITNKYLFDNTGLNIFSFHSSYIEILAKYGLVGFIFVFTPFLYVFFKIRKSNFFLTYGVIFCLIIYMFMESLVDGKYFISYIFLLVYLNILQKKNCN